MADPEFDTDFTLQTSPVTLAVLDGDCQHHALIPGHIPAGTRVACPDRDHDHEVLAVLHTAVAENVQIID